MVQNPSFRVHRCLGEGSVGVDGGLRTSHFISTRLQKLSNLVSASSSNENPSYRVPICQSEDSAPLAVIVLARITRAADDVFRVHTRV